MEVLDEVPGAGKLSADVLGVDKVVVELLVATHFVGLVDPVLDPALDGLEGDVVELVYSLQ